MRLILVLLCVTMLAPGDLFAQKGKEKKGRPKPLGFGNAKLEVSRLISSGVITVTASKADSGGTMEIFDEKPRMTLYRSAKVNPAVILVEIKQPRAFRAFRCMLRQHPGTWSVEVADSKEDLDEKSGSYAQLVTKQKASDGAWSEFRLEKRHSASVLRLTVERTGGGDQVHIGEFEITVDFPVSKFEILPAVRAMHQDTARPLRTNALRPNNQPLALNDPVVWSSQDPQIASVDQKGRVTAVGRGQTTIFAKSGPLSASLPLEVIGPEPSDLDVSHIERLPRYDYDAPKNQPAAGDNVTFRGHIRVWGAPSSANYRWEIDGKTVASGKLENLRAGEDRIVTQEWKWQTGEHRVALTADPDNTVSEYSETNNRVVDRTDALSMGFWVEQSLYDYFHENQHNLDIGSNSWDDWAQRHIRAWNDACADAVWPLTPQGVTDRVRLDKITIVPDGALPLHGGLPGNNPDRNDKTVDLMWGFPSGPLKRGFYEYSGRPDTPFKYEGSLVHELGHARYLVDQYFNDLGKDAVRIKENGKFVAGTELMEHTMYQGVYYNQHGGIMSGMGPYADYKGPWSPAEAYALNLVAGKRARKGNQNPPGDLGDFLKGLPKQTIIQIVDASNGKPAAGVDVQLFRQKKIPEYPNRVFADPSEFQLKSNEQGEVTLPKDFFETATKNVAILRIDLKGHITYRLLENFDVKMAQWAASNKDEVRIPMEAWPAKSPALLEVWGFDRRIAPGDETPDPADHTDFGSAVVGEPEGALGLGKRRVFLLKNRGETVLNIKSRPFVKITGPHASDFTVYYGSVGQIYRFCLQGLIIGFKPQAAGPRKAVVEIESDDPKTPIYRFAIGGQGTSK